MTATSSLHGTAISITQHPSGFSDRIEQLKVTVTKCSNTKLLPLPNNYTSVPGVIMKDRINITLDNMMSNEHFELLKVSVNLDEQIKKEKEWMDNVRRIQKLAEAEQIAEQSHWATYHAVGLDISLSTTNFLNEGQITIVCADQPLYAICKQLQWLYPSKYGLDKMFLIMGGLHIEKQIEQILGKYFEDSGVTDHLVLSKVMSNSDNAFISGSLITRTRYHYQVLASTLNNLLHISFEESGEDDFDLWIEQSVKNSAQFKYCYLGLTLILKFLIYVRAIREANIDAYINVLSYWVRWCFLFDHLNYARYTTVHLTYLWNAKWENSRVYRLLQNGIFTVNKTNKRFSNIHLDQNHEQLNDYLKKNGGIVGLTEDPAALKRFLVSAPLVGELCKDFKASFMDVHGETSTNKHHFTCSRGFFRITSHC